MRYEIRVEGHLHLRWSAWLHNFTVTHLPDGTTMLASTLADSAAVYGLLNRLRDLGLSLVSVSRQLESDSEPIDPT